MSSKWTNVERGQNVTSSSIFNSSFTTTARKKRRTDDEEVKESPNKTTLSKSLASSRPEFPLNLCISHMQSLCAPWHLISTTVFPAKLQKINFSLRFSANCPGSYDVLGVLFFFFTFWCFPCDQRRLCVVFLICSAFYVTNCA